ncbi:MAG: acyl carrier protein phosphodiesterase, partial [Saprospiraceae bacterium]
IRTCIARIRPFAGRYSGPVQDVLCDHLLARHWHLHTDEPFDVFAEKTYRSLAKRREELPLVLQDRVPHMIAGRFLHGYQSRAGLEWALERFSRRLPPDFDPQALADFFFRSYRRLFRGFRCLFPGIGGA